MKKIILLLFCFINISLLAQVEPKEAIVISKDSINSNENLPISIVEDVPSTNDCKELLKRDKLDCFNKNIYEHIKKHFRYPDKAARKKITGKVLITFTINKEGYVENILTSGADELLMEEARRIISLLPRFNPGTQRGKPINVQYSMPLTFRLQ